MQTQDDTKDAFALVTNRIIELLEQGTIPWRKPWGTAGIPQNLISKRLYGGINVLLLHSMNFKQNLFLTWNQLQELKASVKKGEKGTFVVYQSLTEVEVKRDGEMVVETRPILRFYKVFNVAQCRNIPTNLLPKQEGRNNKPLLDCEKVLKEMPLCPKIKHKDNRAYYMPSQDFINMPKLASFESSSSYYGVLFHELVHATGAEKRLARKGVYENPNFGTELYSMEELVAEIGSCYLKSYTGLPLDDLANSASYIDNWLQVLRNDKRCIVQAASKAQHAVDYILNIRLPKEEQKKQD